MTMDTPPPSAPANKDAIDGTHEATEKLLNFIGRIEDLEREKSAISKDVRDIYLEAKVTGFDPKTLREIIRLRKMDPEERDHMTIMLDHYREMLKL